MSRTRAAGGSNSRATRKRSRRRCDRARGLSSGRGRRPRLTSPSPWAVGATRWRSRPRARSRRQSEAARLDRRYPIVSIEDPFAEDDHEAWIAFTKAARRVDHRRRLLTTNAERITQAVAGVQRRLIKINQAGTSPKRKALDGPRPRDSAPSSPRVRADQDTVIAHLAVGWNAGAAQGRPVRARAPRQVNEILASRTRWAATGALRGWLTALE
jgi:hypothetical protein